MKYHEVRLITVEIRRFTRLGKEFPTEIIPFLGEIQNFRSISDEIFSFFEVMENLGKDLERFVSHVSHAKKHT